MDDTLGHDLIDLIYEAGAVPRLWPETLAALAREADAAGAILLTYRGGRASWLCSPGFHALIEAHLSTHWALPAVRPKRLLAATHAGFLRDEDLFSPEEMASEPLFRDHLWPHGFGCGLATAVDMPTGDVLILHVERPRTRGPFEPEVIARLDALRPHLARAALLAARLGLEHAGATAEALALIGLPAAVLGETGRLLRSNAPLKPLITSLLHDGGDRLRILDRTADDMLAAALAGRGHHAARSIPLPRTERRPPTVLHLIPLRRTGRDVFEDGSWILIATVAEARPGPETTLLSALFDLTPAEARVARLLTEGMTTEQAAARLGLSRETVRTHIKAALAKLGVGRQADLVRLLHGLTLGGLPAERDPTAS